MTEEEAKTKWCPLKHMVPLPGGAIDVGPYDCCIGSACMMWRWIGTAKTHGHCGLAGKP